MVPLILQATACREIFLQFVHRMCFFRSFQAAYRYGNPELTFLTILGRGSRPQGPYAISGGEYLPMFRVEW
jgi:hypothetical protein